MGEIKKIKWNVAYYLKRVSRSRRHCERIPLQSGLKFVKEKRNRCKKQPSRVLAQNTKKITSEEKEKGCILHMYWSLDPVKAKLRNNWNGKT